MRYQDQPEQLTIREAFDDLTVMDLKPVLALVGITGLTRKGDLVEAIARVLEGPEQVRSLYARLDELAQKAVQEATHDPDGVWDHPRFRARYGRLPDLGGTGHYPRDPKPTLLRLFFPSYRVLPTNLRATLRTFVPPPPPLAARALEDLPKKVRRPHVNLGLYYRPPDPEEVEPRVRHTARAAERELKALSRYDGRIPRTEKCGTGTSPPRWERSHRKTTDLATQGESAGEPSAAQSAPAAE